MESSKLKNIALLILLITNLLLLFLMVSQRLESRQLQEKVLTDAVQLLESKGISVKADNLPHISFPAAMTLERDSNQEQQLFTALLGEDTVLTQRGPIAQYSGVFGQAEVRNDGGFSVSFALDACPTADDPVASAQEALKRINFTVDPGTSTPSDLTFIQQFSGFPVYSCQVSLATQGNCLASLSGARLVGEPTPAQNAQPLSVATLLVRFRSNIIASGDACTAILSAQAGYAVTAVSVGKLELTPILRLETDIGTYDLNALTGSVSRS